LSILIISHNWIIQNVVEQVGITCGYVSRTAATVREAEAKLLQLGYTRFVLVVIDTGILGERSLDLQMEAGYLLRTWPGQYPGLPIIFLGTAIQKYAILASHAALVPFVITPFSPHDLMQTIQPLLPPSSQPTPVSPLSPLSPSRTRRTSPMLGGDFRGKPTP
jgi:CheY-like chemotaxis protein